MMFKRTLIVGIVVALTLGSTSVAAQEAASVTLTQADIEVDAGETSTVTAEYQFSVESVGSGDAALTSIGGTLWQIPGRSVSGITATVNGESVEPTVTEESAHQAVSVPVEGVSSGDTVTVTLEYQVSGPSGNLQVPIWVPEYSTPGQEAVVQATVTLPQGSTLQGDAFPSAAQVSGNTVEYNLLHVPGFIKAQYGDSRAGLTNDQLYSIVGVLLIIGLVGGGLMLDRRTA